MHHLLVDLGRQSWRLRFASSGTFHWLYLMVLLLSSYVVSLRSLSASVYSYVRREFVSMLSCDIIKIK